jgi:hypothetical protein
MKKFCIILSVLLFANSAKAQTCLPEGITFTTQEQIDGFQSNYPGCISIEGDMIIKGGNSITDLTGLNVLTSIGGNFAISFNYLLTSLDELEGLNSIGGDLNIFGNTLLTSLAGLDGIEAGSIINLRIAGNDTLSTCAIQSICDYLASPNGTIEIHSNAAGCDSPQEVLDECILHLNESAVSGQRSAVSIYPTLTSNTITISTPATPQHNTSLTIYNINGQALFTSQITEQISVVDVSGLSQGVYFVKVTDESKVQVGKFVKQ